MRRTIYHASVVYNGLGTPRANGAVVVQDAGGVSTVIAVGDRSSVIEAHPDAEVVDAGFAISPKPVNAHTHLDLSDMPYAEGSYEGFIAAVVAHARSGRRSLAAVRRGVGELLAAGTVVVGDIVTDPDAMAFLLTHERLSGVAYWEVLAPDPADAERVLRETEELVRGWRRLERPGGMRVGLSPHAPHTVSAPLLQGLARLASRHRLPLQIHVAEAAGERELHASGGGPLRGAFAGLLSHWRPSGRSPVGYLEGLGVLEARPALVHMVHVDEEDVRSVQRHGCVVVHCPRSNAALGCGRFPWELYARHGVSVAMGTDSRGSSPSLSVEEETAYAARLHGERAGAQALVRAAVKGGCRALGLQAPRFVRGDPAEALHVWSAAP